jgi:hypothetical protein
MATLAVGAIADAIIDANARRRRRCHHRHRCRQRRQWTNALIKWYGRAIEADADARQQLARQHSRLLAAGGGALAAAMADAAPAEDDWQHIHFECESGQQLELSPVPVLADDIIDCAVNGQWRVLYDDDYRSPVVEYRPR